MCAKSAKESSRQTINLVTFAYDYAPKSLLVILLKKEDKERVQFSKLNEISSQNLVKTLRIFHKMICKSKNISHAEDFFLRYAW